ncbi:MAG: shikimate kinase [Chitinophagales bacterium]
MVLFLIGFMGSGKSYTGRHLSAQLNIPFIDMDDAIEKQQGKSVSQIFEEEGEYFFRGLEHQFLLDIDPEESQIIATGGGAPCYHDNMELMNSIGTTIFIDTPKEKIAKRLAKGIHRRPLLTGMNEMDLEFFYDKKMEERRPIYEMANFQIQHQDIEVLSKLIQAL